MEAKSEFKYIFSNVNDWLKFAEAKHAGLLIFNSTVIIGVLSNYYNLKQYINKVSLLIGLVCISISIAISIISQFPELQNLLSNKQEKKTKILNLYFFGYLAYLNKEAFFEEWEKLEPNFTPSIADEFIINQILINSRITLQKYIFFKWASILTVIGGLIIITVSVSQNLWHYLMI